MLLCLSSARRCVCTLGLDTSASVRGMVVNVNVNVVMIVCDFSCEF